MRCTVPGHGRVVRVVDAPSCSVLELEDGKLVPFVSDAIRSIRVEPAGAPGAAGGEIVVNDAYLG
jgi:hypothetical protein